MKCPAKPAIEQSKQLNALNLKRVLAWAKMTEEGVSEEEMKVKNKELAKSNKQTIKRILTKEQNAVNKGAKKKK